jgi:hypothetical protein
MAETHLSTGTRSPRSDPVLPSGPFGAAWNRGDSGPGAATPSGPRGGRRGWSELLGARPSVRANPWMTPGGPDSRREGGPKAPLSRYRW